jgi:A/G-specific adenine glycosylase
MVVDSPKASEFQQRLLIWYRRGRRRFTWRGNRTTPYMVLVSELMLRKTGSVTVAQEYDQFIRRYPSPAILAAAPLDEITASIQRLGIADRGRLLKSLAEQLQFEHSGKVPRSLAQLTALPGVGRYIAGAVLCFAYREPVPILDTNVIRVIGRVFSIRSSKSRPHTDASLWEAAGHLVPIHRPVAYNRALLDFAATVCRHKKPRCAICPMTSICDYYRDALPGRS